MKEEKTIFKIMPNKKTLSKADVFLSFNVDDIGNVQLLLNSVSSLIVEDGHDLVYFDEYLAQESLSVLACLEDKFQHSFFHVACSFLYENLFYCSINQLDSVTYDSILKMIPNWSFISMEVRLEIYQKLKKKFFYYRKVSGKVYSFPV